MKKMGIGSSWAIEMDEEKHREALALEIATRAAKWVAAGDKSRDNAIADAAEELRQEIEAGNDETGTLTAELHDNHASKGASRQQIEAIRLELMDAAREAAEDL
jgi:hypothetical protein